MVKIVRLNLLCQTLVICLYFTTFNNASRRVDSYSSISPSQETNYEVFDDDRRSDERSSIDLDTDMSKSGLVLGKDRVLVQFNLDLRWLYLLVTDREEWYNLGQTIKLYFFSILDRFNREKIMKREMLYILSDIRFRNDKCVLKAFSGSFEDSLQYSYDNAKLLVVYVEDGNAEFPTQFCSTFRKSLSDEKLSNLINNNFVLYVTTTTASSLTKRIYKHFGKIPKFPILLVFTPFNTFPENNPFDQVDPSNQTQLNRKKRKIDMNQLESSLFASITYPPAELTGDHIVRLLQR